MTESMIKIEHISKQYRLGQIGSTTLWEELQRFSARLNHREDPADNRLEREKENDFTTITGTDLLQRALRIPAGYRI